MQTLPEQIELPDQPITYQDGRPQAWFSVLLRKLSVTVDGLLQFVDPDNTGDFSLNADDIEQGIEQRVERIANKVFTYNLDDTVAKVEEYDIETGADLLKTKTFSYAPDASVSQVVEVSEGTETEKNFVYDVESRVQAININVGVIS